MNVLKLNYIQTELREQIDGLRELVNTVHRNEECTADRAWLNDGQMLVIKVVHHLTAAYNLASGRIEQPGGEFDLFIDHSSIAVLVRAAFEAAVVFPFIFCDGTVDEKYLRYNVWKMAALSARLQLKGTKNIQARVEPVRKSDLAKVTQLRQEIIASPAFHSLSKDAQNNALKRGNFRLGFSWPDLAEKAGVPRVYAADTYNHLCEYTHSGAVSTLQMRDASKTGEGKDMATLSLLFSVVILRELILNYSRVFPSAHSALLLNRRLLLSIEKWRERKEALAAGYAN